MMEDIHINNLTDYIESITPESSPWAQTLESFAKEHRIPIIDRVSMQFILQLIRLHQAKKILEIGTAIAYSALRMHELVPDANIITIEKNEQMCDIANRNIANYALNNHIKVIHGDALEQLAGLREQDQQFDFVFIDAAKGQYEQYLTAIDPMLKAGSVIVSDNVLFREFVTRDTDDVPKRYRSLVRKLTGFNKKMMNSNNYESSLVPIGDGLLISIKK